MNELPVFIFIKNNSRIEETITPKTKKDNNILSALKYLLSIRITKYLANKTHNIVIILPIDTVDKIAIEIITNLWRLNFLLKNISYANVIVNCNPNCGASEKIAVFLKKLPKYE